MKSTLKFRYNQGLDKFYESEKIVFFVFFFLAALKSPCHPEQAAEVKLTRKGKLLSTTYSKKIFFKNVLSRLRGSKKSVWLGDWLNDDHY